MGAERWSLESLRSEGNVLTSQADTVQARVCQELSKDLKSLLLARNYFPPQPPPLGAAERTIEGG